VLIDADNAQRGIVSYRYNHGCEDRGKSLISHIRAEFRTEMAAQDTYGV